MMTIEKFIEEKGNNWDFCFNDLTKLNKTKYGVEIYGYRKT